ncbi:MAG: hypothetical protein AAGD14_14080 [Planctomycetota bacterium]
MMRYGMAIAALALMAADAFAQGAKDSFTLPSASRAQSIPDAPAHVTVRVDTAGVLALDNADLIDRLKKAGVPARLRARHRSLSLEELGSKLKVARERFEALAAQAKFPAREERAGDRWWSRLQIRFEFDGRLEFGRFAWVRTIAARERLLDGWIVVQSPDGDAPRGVRSDCAEYVREIMDLEAYRNGIQAALYMRPDKSGAKKYSFCGNTTKDLAELAATVADAVGSVPAETLAHTDIIIVGGTEDSMQDYLACADCLPAASPLRVNFRPSWMPWRRDLQAKPLPKPKLYLMSTADVENAELLAERARRRVGKFAQRRPLMGTPMARAAEWIVAQQAKAKRGNDVGTTSLTVFALSGAPSVHRDLPGFEKDLARAVASLLAAQTEEGGFRDAGAKYNVSPRSSALAVAALAHVLRRKPDDTLRARVQKAVTFLQADRKTNKRWRSQGVERTGWYLLALHAAHKAGVEVDLEAVARTRAWLFRQADALEKGEGGPVYDGPQMRLQRAALIVLAQLWSGEKFDDAPALVHKSLKFVYANPPSREFDMHGWYLGALAAFWAPGDMPKKWMSAIGNLKYDQETLGVLAGSWDSVGKETSGAGRVYATALTSLVMQIYYRMDDTPGAPK